jgi:hypothetical protein
MPDTVHRLVRDTLADMLQVLERAPAPGDAELRETLEVAYAAALILCASSPRGKAAAPAARARLSLVRAAAQPQAAAPPA